MSSLFRHIPSVDRFLQDLEQDRAVASLPRTMVKDLLAEFLDLCREEIRAGIVTEESLLTIKALAPRAGAYVRARSRPHFRRVINATGVVIHTNLGRSILAGEAVAAVAEGCRHYSNLEMDLDTGQRGSRYSHVEKLLCRLTGAEAGLVVNNNAAAVLLVLDTLAKGREVVVSRGQLVEIGGSFRIPEVMKKSGAVLREVGATNRTHLRDYEEAIGADTAMLMKVHTSNYRIIGFHKEVELPELVALGREKGLPVFEDLGSGNLFDFSPYGLMPEPTVQQVLRSGVDVVTFSGDKLLGGPQAGVIVGRKDFIDLIKKNQLNRALRIDKMTLAALEAALALSWAGSAVIMARVGTSRRAQTVQGACRPGRGAAQARIFARGRRLLPGAGPAHPPGRRPAPVPGRGSPAPGPPGGGHSRGGPGGGRGLLSGPPHPHGRGVRAGGGGGPEGSGGRIQLKTR